MLRKYDWKQFSCCDPWNPYYYWFWNVEELIYMPRRKSERVEPSVWSRFNLSLHVTQQDAHDVGWLGPLAFGNYVNSWNYAWLIIFGISLLWSLDNHSHHSRPTWSRVRNKILVSLLIQTHCKDVRIIIIFVCLVKVKENTSKWSRQRRRCKCLGE